MTRSAAFSRSMCAVTSPTGVKGWIIAPSSLKCSSHESSRGSNSRIEQPDRTAGMIDRRDIRTFVTIAEDAGVG